MIRWWLVIVLAVGMGCGPNQEEPPPSIEGLPEQTIMNFYTNRSRGGVLEWELWGESANKFPNETVLHLTQVRMVFYSHGVKDAELNADRGEVDERNQNTTARGNVILINQSGRTLKSEVLHWDNAEELIHTEEFVEITDGDQIMTGVGLRTDPNLADAEILEAVQGVVFEDETDSGGENGP